MNTFFCATLAAAGLWLVLPSPVMADIREYEFQLVEARYKTVASVELAVRLVNKTTGKPVPDAVIFARRMDMEPDGMATMTSPLEPRPVAEPGLYRFRTTLGMAGRWRLSLAAKVQGEEGTVEGRLMLEAVP